jgi:hypothetical protein
MKITSALIQGVSSKKNTGAAAKAGKDGVLFILPV